MKYLLLTLLVLSNKTYAMDDCDTAKPLGFIAACYEDKFKLEDVHLNNLYVKLKSVLASNGYDNISKEKYWTLFVESQRYWIKVRDAQCEAKGAFFENNSYAQVIEKTKCLVGETRARTKLLDNEIKFIKNLP